MGLFHKKSSEQTLEYYKERYERTASELRNLLADHQALKEERYILKEEIVRLKYGRSVEQNTLLASIQLALDRLNQKDHLSSEEADIKAILMKGKKTLEEEKDDL